MKKLRLLTLIFCIITACYVSFSSAPQWWEERGVVESVEGENSAQARAKNYEAANVGQLMYIAKRAAEELNEKAEGGAGEAVNSMVASFPTYNAGNPDANYAVLNIGQLKNVAKPFYDRLWELSAANEGSVNFPSSMVFVSGGTDSSNHKYPWAAMPDNPGESDYAINYEIANIGQVKNLFSWSLNDVEEIFEDTDGDGIPDYIENTWSDYTESTRFLSVLPKGSNFRIAENGEVLTLDVQIVDERGVNISGVPLCVLNGNGLPVAIGVSNNLGEYSYTYTADFSASDTNILRVAVEASKQFNEAEFIIKEISNSVVGHSVGEVKNTWLSDQDPTLASGEETLVMPRYINLAQISIAFTQKIYYILGSGIMFDDGAEPGLASEWNLSYSSRFVNPSISRSANNMNSIMVETHNENFNWNIDINYDFAPYISESEYLSRFFCYRSDVQGMSAYTSASEIPLSHEDDYVISSLSSLAEWGNVSANLTPLDEITEMARWAYRNSDINYYNYYENHEVLRVYVPWVYGYSLSDFHGVNGDTVATLRNGIYPLDYDTSENLQITFELIQGTTYDNEVALHWNSDETSDDSTSTSVTLNGGEGKLPHNIWFKATLDNLPASATLKITTKFVPSEDEVLQYENAVTVKEDYYDVHLNGSSASANYSVPLEESSGVKYRKLSLTGRPISDDKPQMESEFDIEPIQNYIDALSLQLHLDVSDISIPVPGSEMILALRRNYNPLVWNFASGLRPHESPEFVLGGNWTTNLVSYLKLVRQNLSDESSRTSPDTAVAYDENACGFSFAYVHKLSPSLELFYPMPSGRTERQNYLNNLSRVGSYYVLKKKYGTVLYYSAQNPITQTVASDRISGSSSSTSYSYYRLDRVEDRYGNVIKYEYPENSKTLIPSRVYVVGRPDLSIYLEQSNGRIVKAWDAEGNVVKYDYETLSLIPAATEGEEGYYSHSQTDDIPYIPSLNAIMDVKALSKVWKGKSESELTLVSTYGYGGILARLDNYSNLLGKPHFNFHINLREFSDCTYDSENNPRVWRFDYGTYLGLYSYDIKTGFYIPTDRPLAISRVIAPSGAVSTFESDTSVKFSLGQNGVFGLLSGSKRRTIVTDADGNDVVYTWLADGVGSANFEFLSDFREVYGFGPDDPFSNPIAIYFPYMRIDHYTGSGEAAQLLGSETFEFDIDAGMALKKVTDFSGNITEYEYSDAIHDSDPRLGVGYAARFSDPTKETRYVGGIAQSKIFTYSDNYRIMESMTDELGRVTQWTVDEMGRRTDEKLYASASDASSGQNPVKQTQFSYDNTFKGFLTDTLLIDGAGQGKNMLSRNVPDANGRLASAIVDPDGLALTTTFAYNRNGRKTLAVDANGNSTSFEYDAFNRLVKRTNPDGSTNLISYDAAGRKISETNENGVETTYAYNANGLRTHTSILMEDSQDDITTQIAYSSAGKILSSTDANGNLTSFEYDGLGRLLKMSKYEGSDTSENGTSYVTTYTYTGNCGSGAFSTDNFKPSTVTDARGNTSIFTHDALYRETSVTLPYGESGSTTSYEYDAVGNKIKETDALGNETQFFYDAQNNLIRTVFADDSEISATYSAAKLQLSQTDEMSNTTTFEYDLAGRKVKSVLPEVYDALSNTNQSPVEEYSYDKYGNLTAMRDALGNLYNTVYDSRNRKIAEVSPAIKLADGSYARPIKQSVYDAVGNVIKAIDPNGNATDTVYDNANRAVSVTFPEVEVGGSGTSGGTLQRPQELRSYDKNGNVISATNPRGIVTETSYNCFNKPVLVVKNAGAASESDKITESLSYDANGNLEVITDGNGNKTKYVYDAMNRRTQAIYGYGSTTTRSDSFAYDALNLTNRKGVAITYDSRNRIQSEAVNKRVYSYDACGRILSVKDESGESSGVSTDVYYSYDALGRLLSETNGGRTHFYQYDLANRRVKSFYGSTSSIFESSTFTHTLDYAYNTNGNISAITDQKGRVTSYTYDLNGNVVEKTHANGMSYTRSYDALNRLKECNSDDVWFNLKYYYDLNGNITYLEERYYINRPEYMMLSNGYDVFDRLTYCSMNDYECYRILYYSYDKNGNRIGLDQNQYWGAVGGDSYLTEEYDVNSLNQLVNLTRVRQPRQGHLPVGEAEESEVSFSYNSRGNVTRIVDSDGDDISLSYDLFDMLESTTVLGSDESVVLETSNAYDYRGRRISHIENEDETQYSYGDGVSVLETKGAKTTLFYRGSDQGGGVGGINYAEYSDGSELNYKMYNLRGDVIATYGSDKSLKSAYMYNPFGTKETRYGDIKTDSHRANTKVEDSGNLLNEGKRFRQLEYGIFLTPDPLEYVDGYNPYIYCGQNPWGKWDPLGLESWNKALYKNQKLANDLSEATARNLGGVAEISETALDVMMIATPVSIVGKSKKAVSFGKLIYNRIKTEISESAAATATQLKKASEALTKAVDNAEGVIKNELTNPESFTMRAAENRLTGKELTGIGITSAIAGVISSALGVNDDTAGLNGADIPFVGQVAGAAFSAGHAGTEAIKRKSESETEKKTSCEESDKQTSNKEKE